MKKILQKMTNLWGLVGKDEVKFLYDEIIALLIKYEESSKQQKKEENSRYFGLADKLIGVYQEVIKERKKGGKWLWVDNPSVIAERLQNPKLGLEKYSDEQIVTATEIYLRNTYTNSIDKKYCQLLKYFIFKNGDEGFSSSLLSTLQQMKDDEKNGRNPQEESSEFWFLNK